MQRGAGQLPGPAKTKEIVLTPGAFEGAMSMVTCSLARSYGALLEF